MKAADLATAQRLCADLNAATALHARLLAGERMRLTVGDGGNASEIVLAAGFADQLRAALADNLARRADAQRAELAALGVEV